MFLPSPFTCKMVKDAPNDVTTNMIGLAQTSREILKDGDDPIFPSVLITSDYLHLTVIVPVSHYPSSARRLIQYVYDRTFSASMQHKEQPKFPSDHYISVSSCHSRNNP